MEFGWAMSSEEGKKGRRDGEDKDTYVEFIGARSESHREPTVLFPHNASRQYFIVLNSSHQYLKAKNVLRPGESQRQRVRYIHRNPGRGDPSGCIS